MGSICGGARDSDSTPGQRAELDKEWSRMCEPSHRKMPDCYLANNGAGGGKELIRVGCSGPVKIPVGLRCRWDYRMMVQTRENGLF